MKCPYCSIEARVQAVEETPEGARLHYLCPNPQCGHYRQEVAAATRPAARAGAGGTQTDAGCGIPAQCV